MCVQRHITISAIFFVLVTFGVHAQQVPPSLSNEQKKNPLNFPPEIQEQIARHLVTQNARIFLEANALEADDHIDLEGGKIFSEDTYTFEKISPHGKYVAKFKGHTFNIVALSSGRAIYTIHKVFRIADVGLYEVQWAPNDRYFSLSLDGKTQVFDVSVRPVQRIGLLDVDGQHCFSPNSRYLAVKTCKTINFFCVDGTVRKVRSVSSAYDWMFSPDGRYVAIETKAGVSVFALKQKHMQEHYNIPFGTLPRFSSDGKYLVAGSTSLGAKIFYCEGRHIREICNVAGAVRPKFLFEENCVAMGDGVTGSIVKIFYLDHGLAQEIKTLSNCMNVRSSSRYAATVTDDKVNLFSWAAGQMIEEGIIYTGNNPIIDVLSEDQLAITDGEHLLIFGLNSRKQLLHITGSQLRVNKRDGVAQLSNNRVEILSDKEPEKRYVFDLHPQLEQVMLVLLVEKEQKLADHARLRPIFNALPAWTRHNLRHKYDAVVKGAMHTRR